MREPQQPPRPDGDQPVRYGTPVAPQHRVRVHFHGGPWDGLAAFYVGMHALPHMLVSGGRYRFALHHPAGAGVVYGFEPG